MVEGESSMSQESGVRSWESGIRSYRVFKLRMNNKQGLILINSLFIAGPV
jgi:hypothetical protein